MNETRQCIEQQIRSAIFQCAGQMLFKAVGILIKEFDDELLWSSGRGGIGTERRQDVSNDLGIATLCKGLMERDDGLRRSIQRLQRLAATKPRVGEVGPYRQGFVKAGEGFVVAVEAGEETPAIEPRFGRVRLWKH